MQALFYKVYDDENVVNKQLNNELSTVIFFKDDNNILYPNIKAKQNLLGYNYCYIPILNRYYFIRTCDILGKELFLLQLEIDVLMSYKQDILQANCEIEEQENFNPFYDDGYKIEVRKTSAIYESDTTINNEKQIILCTIGG